MTVVQGRMTHRRLRAPLEHGLALVHPPWSEVAEMLAANRGGLTQRRHPVGDETLADLALAARRDLVQKAIAYTGQYRDVASVACRTDGASIHDAPLLVSGHQPQLFHPGVWFKNFALHSLGQAHQGIAINLLIDIDLLQRTTIRVPTGSPASPRLTDVAFDRPGRGLGTGMPYEMWPIHDRATFDDFAAEATRQLQGLVAEPVVNELWPAARHAAERGQRLGACLAEGRHQLEGTWGLKTLEVPLSSLCDAPTFHRFVLHILRHLPRLVHIYNAELSAFREAHHIRSNSHPVPELEQADDWLEAPFWLFSDAAPRRQKLWVRQRGDAFQLRAGNSGTLFQLPSDPSRTDEAVEQLAQCRRRGVRLRSRVLTTTMYARLFLSDLFLHGIGGSWYDRLTDAIIERFWECEPPGYVTLTATMKLPLVHHTVTADDLRKVDDLLRQLWHQPDRHVDMLPSRDPQVDQLVRRKWQLVRERPRAGSCRRWHQRIEATNSELRRYVQGVRDSLHDERQRLATHFQHDRLLGSREFSFCLFPGDLLRQTLGQLSEPKDSSGNKLLI